MPILRLLLLLMFYYIIVSYVAFATTLLHCYEEHTLFSRYITDIRHWRTHYGLHTLILYIMLHTGYEMGHTH